MEQTNQVNFKTLNSQYKLADDRNQSQESSFRDKHPIQYRVKRVYDKRTMIKSQSSQRHSKYSQRKNRKNINSLTVCNSPNKSALNKYQCNTVNVGIQKIKYPSISKLISYSVLPKQQKDIKDTIKNIGMGNKIEKEQRLGLVKKIKEQQNQYSGKHVLERPQSVKKVKNIRIPSASNQDRNSTERVRIGNSKDEEQLNLYDIKEQGDSLSSTNEIDKFMKYYGVLGPLGQQYAKSSINKVNIGADSLPKTHHLRGFSEDSSLQNLQPALQQKALKHKHIKASESKNLHQDSVFRDKFYIPFLFNALENNQNLDQNGLMDDDEDDVKDQQEYYKLLQMYQHLRFHYNNQDKSGVWKNNDKLGNALKELQDFFNKEQTISSDTNEVNFTVPKVIEETEKVQAIKFKLAGIEELQEDLSANSSAFKIQNHSMQSRQQNSYRIQGQVTNKQGSQPTRRTIVLEDSGVRSSLEVPAKRSDKGFNRKDSRDLIDQEFMEWKRKQDNGNQPSQFGSSRGGRSQASKKDMDVMADFGEQPSFHDQIHNDVDLRVLKVQKYQFELDEQSISYKQKTQSYEQQKSLGISMQGYHSKLEKKNPFFNRKQSERVMNKTKLLKDNNNSHLQLKPKQFSSGQLSSSDRNHIIFSQTPIAETNKIKSSQTALRNGSSEDNLIKRNKDDEIDFQREGKTLERKLLNSYDQSIEGSSYQILLSQSPNANIDQKGNIKIDLSSAAAVAHAQPSSISFDQSQNAQGVSTLSNYRQSQLASFGNDKNQPSLAQSADEITSSGRKRLKVSTNLSPQNKSIKVPLSASNVSSQGLIDDNPKSGFHSARDSDEEEKVILSPANDNSIMVEEGLETKEYMKAQHSIIEEESRMEAQASQASLRQSPSKTESRKNFHVNPDRRQTSNLTTFDMRMQPKEFPSSQFMQIDELGEIDASMEKMNYQIQGIKTVSLPHDYKDEDPKVISQPKIKPKKQTKKERVASYLQQLLIQNPASSHGNSQHSGGGQTATFNPLISQSLPFDATFNPVAQSPERLSTQNTQFGYTLPNSQIPSESNSPPKTQVPYQIMIQKRGELGNSLTQPMSERLMEQREINQIELRPNELEKVEKSMQLQNIDLTHLRDLIESLQKSALTSGIRKYINSLKNALNRAERDKLPQQLRIDEESYIRSVLKPGLIKKQFSPQRESYNSGVGMINTQNPPTAQSNVNKSISAGQSQALDQEYEPLKQQVMQLDADREKEEEIARAMQKYTQNIGDQIDQLKQEMERDGDVHYQKLIELCQKVTTKKNLDLHQSQHISNLEVHAISLEQASDMQQDIDQAQLIAQAAAIISTQAEPKRRAVSVRNQNDEHNVSAISLDDQIKITIKDGNTSSIPSNTIGNSIQFNRNTKPQLGSSTPGFIVGTSIQGDHSHIQISQDEDADMVNVHPIKQDNSGLFVQKTFTETDGKRQSRQQYFNETNTQDDNNRKISDMNIQYFQPLQQRATVGLSGGMGTLSDHNQSQNLVRQSAQEDSRETQSRRNSQLKLQQSNLAQPSNSSPKRQSMQSQLSSIQIKINVQNPSTPLNQCSSSINKISPTNIGLNQSQNFSGQLNIQNQRVSSAHARNRVISSANASQRQSQAQSPKNNVYPLTNRHRKRILSHINKTQEGQLAMNAAGRLVKTGSAGVSVNQGESSNRIYRVPSYGKSNAVHNNSFSQQEQSYQAPPPLNLITPTNPVICPTPQDYIGNQHQQSIMESAKTTNNKSQIGIFPLSGFGVFNEEPQLVQSIVKQESEENLQIKGKIASKTPKFNIASEITQSKVQPRKERVYRSLASLAGQKRKKSEVSLCQNFQTVSKKQLTFELPQVARQNSSGMKNYPIPTTTAKSAHACKFNPIHPPLLVAQERPQSKYSTKYHRQSTEFDQTAVGNVFTQKVVQKGVYDSSTAGYNPEFQQALQELARVAKTDAAQEHKQIGKKINNKIINSKY